MTPLESLTTILVTLLGGGGVLGLWVAKKTTSKGGLDRDEAEAAEVHKKLDPEAQFFVTAMLDRVKAVEEDFEAKLATERLSRKRIEREFQAKVDDICRELDEVRKENTSLRAWALDLHARWNHHRQQEHPPPLTW